MENITEKAFAKINLTLEIVGKRADGYHLLSSVMQTVDLFDEVSVCKNPGGINIFCDNPAVPTDSGNTVYTAADLLIKEYGLGGGFDIDIKKRIPICAGLGGPSADAAACIRAINKLCNLGLTSEQMKKTGVKVGADVPFLIDGGCALCEGIGEILTPCKSGKMILLLVKPAVKVSTKWAYEEFDKNGNNSSKNGAEYFNDFEDVVIKEFPVIGEIKKDIKNNGAVDALMSGSGSCVFGIFEDEISRDICQKQLINVYPDAEFICTKTI